MKIANAIEAFLRLTKPVRLEMTGLFCQVFGNTKNCFNIGVLEFLRMNVVTEVAIISCCLVFLTVASFCWVSLRRQDAKTRKLVESAAQQADLQTQENSTSVKTQ